MRPQNGLAWLLGVVLLQQLPYLSIWYWCLILLPLVFIIGNWPYKWPVLACCGGFLWALLFAQLRLATALPAELVRDDLLVEGYIASIPIQRERYQRFEFTITQVSNSPVELRLPLHVRLNDYIDFAEPTTYQAGEYWRFTIRLKPPYGFMNPGGFDYEAWLFGRNIRATGYLTAAAKEKLAEPDYRYWLTSVRQNLLVKLQSLMPDAKHDGIITALAFGYQDDVNADDWELLLQTGTNHLMSISGLHIGLIATMMFVLVNRLGGWLLAPLSRRLPLWPLPRIAALAACVAATIYALLSGLSIPTQRALIMLLVALLSILCYRPVRPGHGLLLALVVVLIIDPFAVNQPGFWLSFAGVALLIYTLAYRQAKEQASVITRLLQWSKIQILLVLGLLPLMLFWFGRTALTAAAANWVAIPWIGFLVVPLILLAVVCSSFWPTAATWLLAVTDQLLQWLWILLEYFTTWPFAQLQQAQPTVLVLCCGIIGVVLLLAPQGFPNRCLGALALLPLLWPNFAQLPAGAVELTVLDVGQGTAVVVQTAEHTLVYDTGARFSEQFNAGSAVVASYLRYAGVQQLDTLVISHEDNDHSGGAVGVMDAYPAKTILASAPDKLAEYSAKLCQYGQQWVWDQVHFKILHPETIAPWSDNNRSCVLQIVTTAQHSILLTGDIEQAVEKELLKQQRLMPIDILLVPHHGSRTSSSVEFIQQLQPKYAVVTAGYLNRYDFPKPDVIARYQQVGTQIIHTGLQGAVRFRLDQTGISEPIFSRQQQQRYWHHQAN